MYTRDIYVCRATEVFNSTGRIYHCFGVTNKVTLYSLFLNSPENRLIYDSIALQLDSNMLYFTVDNKHGDRYFLADDVHATKRTQFL